MKTILKKKSISSGKKVFSKYRPLILSRHSTHNVLRGNLPLFKFRSCVRFGSTTEMNDGRIQINKTQGIRNSANKLLMKECFDRAGVKTASWCKAIEFKSQFKYPIVVKHHYGSRGTGNHKFDDSKSFEQWKKGRNMSEYIIEQYMPFLREYRLHITEDGCFYTCRKMLKEGTPEKEKWHRHDENSVWILESNKEFNKPSNWKQIEKDCVAALKTVGLDVCSFDVKVQGKEHTTPEYILIECNSASSFGEVTGQKYKEILPKLIQKKYEQRHN